MEIRDPGLGAALAGCVEGGGADKDTYRAMGASAALGDDPCARHGWYGDAECDAFCASEDPDCAPSECARDAECDAGERCAPGPLCRHDCAAGDPSCCFANRCVAATPPTVECRSDADCAASERCVPGELCRHGAAGDPSCCEGNRCAPREAPEGAECTTDADCMPSEGCVAGELCTSGARQVIRAAASATAARRAEAPGVARS